VYQVLAVGVIALIVWFLAHNTATNMRQRGIQSGFGFLLGTAGFDIGESLFAFDSGESYLQAYLVGVTNTLRVAILGMVFTTLLGTLLGIGRFSRNALVRGLCRAYVEAFRNIPLLLQLLMWYLFFTEVLPEAAQAWQVGPLFLSKGGLNFPIPVWALGHQLAAGGLVSGIITHGLAARGHSHPALTELRSVDTIQERKRAMIEQADGFIALPGGIGTLEEVFEVWTLAQLEPSQQSKPIGLLNVQGFFDPLLGMVDRMIEQGFLPASHRQMLQVSASPDALLQAFANYRPVAEPKWLS
jgi:uncharacterized protein (TIGR00730 family)